jgi:hypothetical protein
MPGAGQSSVALGEPRYSAWRLNRTHVCGAFARLKTGQERGTVTE